MMLVQLDELSDDAREQLARLTLPAAREHAPEWLPDLDAAREEISDALERCGFGDGAQFDQG